MSEDVTIKMLEAYIKTFEKWNDLYPITPQLIETLKSTLEIIQKQQKEIEERDKYNITTLPFEKIKADIDQNKNIFIFGKEYISKDKIKEKLQEIDKEYAEIIEKSKNDLELVNISAQRHNAMQLILEELLEEK